MSKKKNQKGGRIETVPEHLRKFVESIVIREDLDDPKERARRALEKKRKQKEEEEAKLKAANKRQEINEEDIKLLVGYLHSQPLFFIFQLFSPSNPLFSDLLY